MAKSCDDLFDEILLEIGNNGKFQKMYNFLYNFLFNVCATILSMSLVLVMAIPEHWCFVPGRDTSNFSLEEWKTIYIPRNNESKFESCSMYGDNNITECQFGFDYDKTWYLDTIPSQQNWFCEKEIEVTKTFTAARIGEIVGSFVFGQIGDKYGRQLTLYLSLLALLVGRITAIFTLNFFTIFLLANFFGNLSSLSLYQAPLIITMEISADEDRATASLVQSVSWTVGICILPLIYWYVKRWQVVTWIAIVPLFLFLIPNKYMIESPRWLASQGKFKKCLKVLKQIAKVNKRTVSDSHIAELRKFEFMKNDDDSGKVPGLMALFQTWTMIKLTFLNMSGWTCYLLMYITFTLNITNLGGNPFMNFFWQSAAELPGYIIGKYMCDYWGRKISRISSFVVTASSSFVIAFLIKDPNKTLLVCGISVFLKCISSITYYAVNLQSLEIYPTSLRQTGTSVCTTTAFMFSLITPYIVLLGTSVDASYPYILTAAFGMFGAICSLFLPETLNQKLPESTEEVEEFMKKSKFWHILPKQYDKCNKDNNSTDI